MQIPIEELKILAELLHEKIAPDVTGRYRQLEEHTKKTSQEVDDSISRWKAAGTIQVDGVRTYSACPSCESIVNTVSIVCSECDSEVHREKLYKHGPHVFPFDDVKEPYCKHCNKTIPEGKYETVGSRIICGKDPPHMFPEISTKLIKYNCTNCSTSFTSANAKIKPVYTYVVSDSVKRIIEAKEMPDISSILRSYGFKIETMPMGIEGKKSGITHSLDEHYTVGRDDGNLIIVRWESEVSTNVASEFFGRMLDIDPKYRYLLGKRCERDTKMLLETFGTPHIINENMSELGREFDERLSANGLKKK